MNLNELVLYRPLTCTTISKEPLELFKEWSKTKDVQTAIDLFNSLLAFKEEYTIDGQLFQVYLTMILAYHENSFTFALERKEEVNEALKTIALHDCNIIYDLFHYDFKELEKIFKDVFDHYNITKHAMNEEVHLVLSSLCKNLANTKSPKEFYDILVKHYSTYGVGFYGLNKAFRFDGTKLVPINHVDNYLLKDIIGYDMQKEKLCDNTKAFLAGLQANNVLLYGDSGTGKSTSIKAILNEYYKEGLRVVEVYKHQFQNLPEIIHELHNRNYKFIIYMDDLSFEEFEIEYKYLKSVIEGGLEQKPNNIVIYATSNRRHIIKQTWSERENQDEINLNDAMQEKQSLASRFGITILYIHPKKQEYLEIVDFLAKKNNVSLSQEELHSKALTWSIRNGGFSGRCATQFIAYLLSQEIK